LSNVLIVMSIPPNTSTQPTSLPDTQRVKDLLGRCGLHQYYERFADEGFDQLKSVRMVIGPPMAHHHSTNDMMCIAVV
jgi:hypothetical protein